MERAGTPGPKAIGIDEISIRKGHTYRIVVSDLIRGRPIWFGGKDRSEASMKAFYDWLGPKKAKGIRLAVMDMWKPFRTATNECAPQAAILFDKFHVMRHLGEALDKVRKAEYARLSGKERKYIKGQKYVLLSHRENLTAEGRQSLKTLLAANKRLNTAYLLKESFGQLWEYKSEAWARKFFENWKASLKWQRLKPYETIGDGHDFASGRQFAAWLGMVPGQYSSGGKQRLGRITKAGDRYLRTLLILGARSVLQSARKKEDAVSRWTKDVEGRRGYWKAVVAMAAKNARLAWAVLRRGEDFKLYGQGTPAAA